MTDIEKRNKDIINSRIESGEIIEQKSWKMIRELNSFSEERLNSIALESGKRTYTYRQMFRWWELYAEVFSSLGITQKNKARVCLIADASVECIFTIYALNMMGVSVSIHDTYYSKDNDKFKLALEKEGITDIVITSYVFTDEDMKRFLSLKRELCLNHIIVDYLTVCGPISTSMQRRASKDEYRRVKRVPGLLFMDELLVRYEAYPIAYGNGRQDKAAVILHTSGTTSGIQKPIPLSDRAFNEAVVRLLKMDSFRFLEGRAVVWMPLPPSSSFGTVDMLHLPLAFGGCIVTTPLREPDPMMIKVFKHYHINTMFLPADAPNVFMSFPIRPDFSDLELVVVGGGFVSAETKKKYDKYLSQCGAKAKLIIGYGLSEAGAACFVAPSENEEASIGFPMPGVKVKLYSEEDGCYYNIEDGQNTGVMYISTKSLSSGRIGRKRFFKLDKIDGEEYLNTNDLVRVNKDGSLSFVGRANRYFVNNDGVRFDAGLVETAIAAQPGIRACGLVPDYSKAIHDTVPVLYVEIDDRDGNGRRTVYDALRNTFIRDDAAKKTNLPSQCVICSKLPRNSNGKVDIHRIRDDGVKGRRYKVQPVRKEDKLSDIKLYHIRESDMVGKEFYDAFGIPDELEHYYTRE